MANFGETLKRERELRKISLREVSEATKIGLRYLEALEGNRFDQLPGGLFNKGFIRAYAKFIGLDGETLVNVYLYDIAHQPKAPVRPRSAGGPQEEAPLPPAPAPAPAPATALARRFPVQLLTGLAAALIILGAAGWLFLIRLPAGATIDAAGPAEPPLQEAGLLRRAPAASQEPQEQEPAAIPQEITAPAPEPATPAPEAAPEKPPPVQKDLALFLATMQTTGVVVLCDGVEKVRRELSEGETVAVSCGGEVLLSAGNAGALSLSINGHECLPLGQLGAPLQEFPLNAQRAREICPPEREAR
jgi:helix-turn-helix protein